MTQTKIYPSLVLEALSMVRCPATGKNLVEAEMVEDDMRIDGLKLSFSLIFDKANAPFIKSIVKASEQAIYRHVGEDVELTIKTKEPDLRPEREEKVLPKVKNVLAVFSGKGGVGKSTIAANLAVALARLGHKVGLLDADIFGPSVPKMFGCEDARPILEEVEGRELIKPEEHYGVKMLSIGFFVNVENPILWRGSMASNALKQLITEANWGELDYLILDMPPGTSDIHLTLVQTLGITGAIVVTTPQDVALADAIKGIAMFREEQVNVPVLGLVENMAWFTPEELPNNRYYLFGKEGGKRLAQEQGIPFLGQIPIVQSICEQGDMGSPIATKEDSLVANQFLLLADEVHRGVELRNEKLAPTEKVELTK